MKPAYLSNRVTLASFKDSFDSKTWYERLNLLGKLKRFCQLCTGKFVFWCLVAIFTLLEPLLCSNKPVGRILIAQVIVLGVSSLLYIIQLIGVASREWDKIIMIQALSASNTMIMPVSNFTPLKLFIFFTAEGEYILEFCCLAGGWATIFFRPGLAVLRCFRVFRLLWFYEVEIFKRSTEFALSPIFGVEFVKRGFKVLKFAIKSLTALGNEMFRLTNATKGGLLLMMIFFYSAFVMGTTLWIETDGEDAACNSFPMCTYTMMRLTFYDGTGFDFTYSLTKNHRFLFFLCIMYMCLTSFGILNGLVGIFGTAFAAASDDAFNDSDDEDEDNESEEGDPDDPDIKDNYTSFRGMYADNNKGPHDSQMSNNSGNNNNNTNNNNNQDDEEEQYKMVDDDEMSEMSEGGERIQPLAHKQPSMSKMEIRALQNRLKGALGAKSNFAMLELTKLAQEPPKAKPVAPRRTLKDIITANKIGQRAGIHPMFREPNQSNSSDRSPLYGVNIQPADKPKPNHSHENKNNNPGVAGMFGGQKKQKHLHAAVGMFASLKNQKSSRGFHSHSAHGASSHHAHNASSGANNGPFAEYMNARNMGSGVGGPVNTADVKAINASVHTLQRTVEAQSLTMSALIGHIQVLTQQLHALHPEVAVKPFVPPENEQKPPRKMSHLQFVSPRKSGDAGTSSAPGSETPPPHKPPLQPTPQTAPQPQPQAQTLAPKSSGWGFNLGLGLTKSPPTSNNSSAVKIEKPTPIVVIPEPVPVPVPVPTAQVYPAVAEPVPKIAPQPSVSTPVVTESSIEPPAQDAPPVSSQLSSAHPVAVSPAIEVEAFDHLNSDSASLADSLVDLHLSPALSVLPVDAQPPASSPSASSAALRSTKSFKQDVETEPEREFSPLPEQQSPRVAQTRREPAPDLTLDSLSMSRDVVAHGPGIDLSTPSGALSPVWSPSHAIEEEQTRRGKESSFTIVPALPHQSSIDSLSPTSLHSHGHSRKHRRHQTPGHRSAGHSNHSNNPSSTSPHSILGLMGKIKQHKHSPLDEFSSSIEQFDLPAGLAPIPGATVGDSWNPHNRPQTSPFQPHKQLARPSTTPNPSSGSRANTLGGNQQGESMFHHAGAGRRADTGNGWIDDRDLPENSDAGPDDVTEMTAGDQNV